MGHQVAREAVGIALPVRRVRLSPGLRWQVVQAGLDFVTVFLAAMGGYGLYLLSDLGSRHFDLVLYGQINVGIATITLFSLIGHGVYGDHLGLLRVEAVRRLVRGVFAALLLTLALSFFLKAPGFSRLTVLVVGPLVVLALVTQRVLVWSAQARLADASPAATPVLVYGAGETGRLLARHLLEEHQIGLRPVALLDDAPELHGTEVRVGPGVDGARLQVSGGESVLEHEVRRTNAAAVFIALPSASSERLASLMARLDDLGIEFFCVPAAGGQAIGTLTAERIAGLPLYRRRRADDNPMYRVANRSLDLVGGAVLLAVTAPLIVLGAVLVRAGSSGPAFFRQRRVGLDGREFTIWKLRTMHLAAPSYADHPEGEGDPRVTTVGRWLRRLSIDELPQLWNVLTGDMSLVGPRPEMPYLVERYGPIERQRLTVKPGLTGLWQISADRAFHIHDNIHYDLNYIENRSLSLDIAILLLTPFALIARDRAY